jgi:ubiquinone/menaquinone biosynthesis C-methylase UbiE
MKTDAEVLRYLQYLWHNPTERHLRHLALRNKYTVSLTDNAPDTVSWAVQRIAPHLNQHERLLDAGCGPGYYLQVLENKITGLPMIGIDIAIEALSKAQKVTQVPLVQGSILNLPFGNGIFDVAMANRMLNQTGNIGRALCEIYRVLTDRGKLFIVTAELDAPSLLQATHTEALLEVGFPPKFTRRSSLLDQRLGRENSTEWLLDTGYRNIQLEDYRREVILDKPEEALELYATGLIFHRSAGLDEAEVSAEQWVALYRAVEAKLNIMSSRKVQIKNVEGASLIIATK